MRCLGYKMKKGGRPDATEMNKVGSEVPLELFDAAEILREFLGVATCQGGPQREPVDRNVTE